MKKKFSKIRFVCFVFFLVLACIPSGITTGTPELQDQPTEPPPPTLTFTPDPQTLIEAATLYKTDFEKGYPPELVDKSQKWVVVTEEDGNSIFCNEVLDDWSTVHFGLNAWENYAVSLKVKFLSSKPGQKTEILFRITESAEGYRANISNDGWVTLAYDPPYSVLGSSSVPVNRNEWFQAQLQAAGDNIKYFFNNELVIEVSDDTRASGQASFNASPNSQVCVDDLQVWALDESGNPVESPEELVIEPYDGTVYSLSEKLENRPTVPVFYPWPWQNPDGVECGETARFYFDCDTEETPYSLVWTGAGRPEEIDSTEPTVSQAQSVFMRSDPDTLYLAFDEWRYWIPNGYTLSPDSKFYLDEIFGPHVNSEYGTTKMINFEHPDWPGVMAEKALNYKDAGYDGLMLDWWNNYMGNGQDSADVEFSRLAIAKAIRERVGEDFILMGNVNDNSDDPTAGYLSGVFMELWKPYPELGYTVWQRDVDWTKWKLSMERMEELLIYWDTNLLPPRIIAFEPWKITTGDYIEDRYTEENYKYARLYTAMAMVIPENGYILYADNNDDWDSGDHQHAYYDFYHTDFGKPTSDMIPVVEGVAYKQFERGIIAYNRTKEEVQVTLPNGEQFTMGPLEGLFLELE